MAEQRRRESIIWTTVLSVNAPTNRQRKPLSMRALSSPSVADSSPRCRALKPSMRQAKITTCHPKGLALRSIWMASPTAFGTLNAG
jgi:hypothetical protein